MIERDDDEWEGGWDAYGIGVADGRTVAITIGVIGYGDDVWVGIGVGSQAPVVLTNTIATEAAEAFRWAITERELVVADHRSQREADVLKHHTDCAILTRNHWQRIHDALEHHATTAAPVRAALTALRDGAPPGWTDE